MICSRGGIQLSEMFAKGIVKSRCPLQDRRGQRTSVSAQSWCVNITMDLDMNNLQRSVLKSI